MSIFIMTDLWPVAVTPWSSQCWHPLPFVTHLPASWYEKPSSNETWLCSYCVMRLWILRKPSVFTGFLWPCPSRGSSRGGRHHTSLLTRGGRSPGSLGPSLASEGGVLISPGWRWECRLTDKALGAASSLLGDGRRHNSLIHLCWYHLIAAGWGSNSRWEDEAHSQRGGKTRQLSAWSPLIPHCGAA